MSFTYLLAPRDWRGLLRSILVLTLGLLGQQWSLAGALPAPPATFESPYAAPTGRTIAVGAGGNFQAALDSAQLGDTIILQAGATYTGPFLLPNKTTGSGWIYIQSSAYSSLPSPGTRVSPNDARNMAKIQVPGALARGAIEAAPGAHHYRFVGLEFQPVPGQWVTNLIIIGWGETSLATLPRNITFDRCFVHGDPSVGGRRGIAINGIALAVVDSYVSDFKERGADSQGIWSFNGPGPLKIVNNYIESAGENFLTGGADPTIVDVVPSDIEIRNNHFFKQPVWVSQGWSIKNSFELKLGRRVLVANNRFENNYPVSQPGFAIQITPRNENNSAPWSVISDVSFVNNVIVNSPQGINLLGVTSNGNDTPLINPLRMERILIRNNLILLSAAGATDGRLFQILAGPKDVTIDHNTGFSDNTAITAENIWTYKADNFVFTNNIVTFGVYGIISSDGSGTNALNAQFTNWQVSKNAFIGIQAAGVNPATYPSGNFWPIDKAAVKFVGAANGDYSLAADSPYKGAGTDGQDLGANVSAPIVLPRTTVPAAPSSISIE